MGDHIGKKTTIIIDSVHRGHVDTKWDGFYTAGCTMN